MHIRSLVAVLFGLLISGTSIAGENVNFSISPRAYFTYIDSSDFAEVTPVTLGGLSITIGPAAGSWDLTVSGLVGSGDSGFTELAEDAFGGQEGQFEIDRVDYEALWRYRFKDSPVYIGFGARFIDIEEEFIGEFSGPVEFQTTEIVLGEFAVGLSGQVSEGSRHSLFSNLVVGIGSFESDLMEVGEPDDSDDGATFLFDANLGYQYVMNQTSSISARYRVIAVQTAGFEDELTVVHGPEIALTFRF